MALEARFDHSKDVLRNIHRLGSMIYRKKALAALIADGEPAVLPLLKALHHRDEDVRRCAAIALGEIGDPRAIAPLCEALQDFYGEIRDAASDALVKIGEPAILSLLDSVRQFRQHRRPSRLPFIEVIETRITVTHDPARRSATDTLGKLGPVALPHLSAALKDEDYGVRRAAAEGLGAIQDSRAVPVLVDALKDRDHQVRTCAAVSLGRIGDGAAVPELCWLLADAHELDGCSAATALGAIGDERAVVHLCHAAHDRNSSVRNAAASALDRMGDAQALRLNVLASFQMTPAQKYDALEALRARSRKGELNFRQGAPTVEEYCRSVMEQAGSPALHEDARLVLLEAQSREERRSYLRASEQAEPSGQLLRAASGEGANSRDELVRASRDPS